MTSTPFEKTLAERFTDNAISPSSQKLYFSNLRRLNDGQPLQNFKFLDKPEVIAEKLKEYAPTTQRNFYIAVVSALNIGGEGPKHKKLYSKYYDIMLSKNKEVKEIKHDPETLPKWDEITEKRNTLGNQVASFAKNSFFINTKQIKHMVRTPNLLMLNYGKYCQSTLSIIPF